MPAVDRLSVDGRKTCDNPSWREVMEAILDAESAHEPVTFSLSIRGEEAVTIASFDPDFGFYLVARQEDETANYQLIQPEWGAEIVSAVVGDLEDRYPRLLFVKRATALEALWEFYAHGKRARALTWMEELEAVNRYFPK